METETIRIKELAKKCRQVDSVMYAINKETLKAQHRKQLQNKATGIDRVTKMEYEANLEANIEDLLNRMKRQSYKPKAVRRVNIPKAGSNKTRPLGIPSYEDKLVQGCMAEILNAIYEPMFEESSFGFRPNRSCHDAIMYMDKMLHRTKANYVVDIDIKRIL